MAEALPSGLQPASGLAIWTRFVNLLLEAVEIVAAILLMVDLLVVMGSVLFRFLFSAPLVWSDDVARMLLLAVIFLGAAAALARGENAGVSFFVDRLQTTGARTGGRDGRPDDPVGGRRAVLVQPAVADPDRRADRWRRRAAGVVLCADVLRRGCNVRVRHTMASGGTARRIFWPASWSSSSSQRRGWAAPVTRRTCCRPCPSRWAWCSSSAWSRDCRSRSCWH